MTAPVPGPEPLTGYRLRDYDDLIATLGRSRDSQRISKSQLARLLGCLRVEVIRWLTGKVEARGRRVFDLADALGYDLALIPHDTDAVDGRPVECKLARPAGDAGPTQRCACEPWQPCAQTREDT